MHEWGLVSAAAQQFVTTLDAPIAGVELRVGPGVDPEVARQAFAAAVNGSLAQHAAVQIRQLDPELTCLTCAQHYRGNRLATCPGCGGDGLVTVVPPEVEIAVLETTDATPESGHE